MTRRPREVRAVVAALVLLVAAGCARGGDAAVAKGPYGKEVAEAIPALEKSTGLKFKRPPKLELRSKEQVRQFVERTFTESQAAKNLSASEAAYKRLGLIPDTLDLHKLFVDVLSEQIAGFYDPKTKVLYVVQGTDPAMAGVTVRHELVHALQDQYLNLDSLQHVEGNDDRAAAAQAVIEGQAVYEQLASMSGDGSFVDRIPGGWDRIRQTLRDEQAGMPVLASAPMVIQEELIFPYLSGAEFVRRFKAQRPGGNPLADLPRSTEQVLHADAFFGAKPDAPLAITLPALGGGARVTYDNTFGEFETRLLLFQHLKDQAAAARGAAGWAGDRYALVDTPRGQGLVWLTLWDTPVDAADFADMMAQVVAHRYGIAPAATAGSTTPGGAKSWSAGGRALALTAADVAGHPAVLYVDVPSGASTSVVDLSKVSVR
ncbi:MAG TPA: hypothetical protein VNS52_01350 [Gemmatimonadaceae bacterium]|nr:hypothetical protein [Gemmatimonadaceae bacterium]